MRGRKRSTQLQELHDVYLPPEIWRQILARLPRKTLMQFRFRHDVGTILVVGLFTFEGRCTGDLHTGWSHLFNNKILSFHFDSEELRYIKLSDIIEQGMCISLFVFVGSLAAFGILSVRSCIWVLDGKHQWWQYWNQNNNSDARKLFQDIGFTPHQILYIEDTGTLLVRCGRELVAYYITRNRTQCLSEVIALTNIDTYVESLVLHKGYEGVVSTSGQQYKMDDTK